MTTRDTRAAALRADGASQVRRLTLANEDLFERSLPVALLRAREAVLTHMRPVLRSHGTTEQQWRVLRALNETAPLDKTSLADRAILLMPSLLRILKDLQKAGLIRMVKSTKNARLTGAMLTAAGANYVRNVTRDLAARGRIVSKRIGDNDVATLLDLLGKIEGRLRTFTIDGAIIRRRR